MPNSALLLKLAGFAAGLVLLLGSTVHADPASGVARLAYLNGAVSFSPAGEAEWVQATLNRPLVNGDRLWSAADGRTELQLDGAMLRMNSNTGIAILGLDDHIAQLQLTAGTLNVRVMRLGPNQVFELDTPNLAFTLRESGEFRIAVDPGGTSIFVRKGRGEARGEGAAYLVDTSQPYRFTGAGLRDYHTLAAGPPDAFDRWTAQRDQDLDRSVSIRYVSPGVIGYQDLDASGIWRADAVYGQVWVPLRVAPGWVPYRFGHWAWVHPWGWTWIDDAPWGFAVSHYGRWANLRGTWAWVPGPLHAHARYAPALRAFGTPGEHRVHGPNDSGERPPQHIFERPGMAQNTVPAARAGFIAQPPVSHPAFRATPPAAAVAAQPQTAPAQAAPRAEHFARPAHPAHERHAEKSEGSPHDKGRGEHREEKRRPNG